MTILELKWKGLGVTALAGQTGLDRRTVKSYPERGLGVPVHGPREPKERLAEECCNVLPDRPAVRTFDLRPVTRAARGGGSVAWLTQE